MPLNSSKALFVLDILRRETDVEHRLSAPALLKRLEEHVWKKILLPRDPGGIVQAEA